MPFDAIHAKTYGLIGYPLTHSFSIDFFNRKFKAEGINARYVNFEIPDIGDLMEVIAEASNLSGLNVTIPYKEQVIPYLDELDPVAKRIGAVNVIKIIPGKGPGNFRLVGYNSDVVGFTDSIRPMLRPCNKGALVLGTGGAAKAVCVGLEQLGVRPLLVSRTPGKGNLTYADITPGIMAENNVIVNTTPLGMYPHMDECPDLPYECMDSDFLCYDLLYNPDETLFMKNRPNTALRPKTDWRCSCSRLSCHGIYGTAESDFSTCRHNKSHTTFVYHTKQKL